MSISYVGFLSQGLATAKLGRNFCRHPVEVLARLARIDQRNGPSHHELAEREQQSNVDDAPDADLEQILMVGSADRQEKVIHHRQRHQTPEKQGLTSVQVLEARIT